MQELQNHRHLILYIISLFHMLFYPVYSVIPEQYCLQIPFVQKKIAEIIANRIALSRHKLITNGTIGLNDCPILRHILNHKDGHITVSPKPLQTYNENIQHIKLRSGTDLKIIIPTSFELEYFRDMDFKNFYLQPIDRRDGSIGGTDLNNTLELCERYGYLLSVQTHKFIGLK